MNKDKSETEMLSKNLFDSLGKDNDEPSDSKTQTRTQPAVSKDSKIQKNTIPNQVDHFKNMIKNGTKQQQHDASKAVGYSALIDGLNTQQKYILRDFILDILRNDSPKGSLAFALLEALERIDPDAFWQFVVTNYMEVYR